MIVSFRWISEVRWRTKRAKRDDFLDDIEKPLDHLIFKLDDWVADIKFFQGGIGNVNKDQIYCEGTRLIGPINRTISRISKSDTSISANWSGIRTDELETDLAFFNSDAAITLNGNAVASSVRRLIDEIHSAMSREKQRYSA